MLNVFKTNLLRTRCVSIWGLGYLGYTSILEMQSKGFSVKVWDYLPDRIEALRQGSYPEAEIKAQWSISNEIPVPEMGTMELATDPHVLLDAPVQLVCIPNDEGTHHTLQFCAAVLAMIPQDSKTLVLFLSAGQPGYINTVFAPKLITTGCHLATAFRKDWYFEEMLTVAKPRIIASNDPASLEMARFFFDMLEMPTQFLGSLKAGEILAHAAQAFENISSSFVNQLAFSFPHTDIRELARLLIDGFAPRMTQPSMGYTDMRSLTSLSYLTGGATPTAAMTILEEARRSTLSTLLAYADLLIAHKINSVAIFGLPPMLASQRDVRVSPSRILAEYFHSNGIQVSVHSPDFDETQMAEVLPFAKWLNLSSSIKADAIILMTNQLAYRRFTQSDIDRLGISSAQFCIDNPGILKHFRFHTNTRYHIPGDGRLCDLRG